MWGPCTRNGLKVAETVLYETVRSLRLYSMGILDMHALLSPPSASGHRTSPGHLLTARLVTVAVSACLLAACGKSGGGNGEGGPSQPHTPAPEQPTGTVDREDLVHLEWTMPAGAAPLAIGIERDGAELARLPADATSYEDRTAEPGSVDAPSIAAEGDVEAVRLSWSMPRGTPGTEHLYRIVALYASDAQGVSIEVPGRRGAPSVSGYRVLRDGEPLASLDPGETSYVDDRAAPGSIEAPVLDVDEATDAVGLAWTDPVARPGPMHRYSLEALTSLGSSPASDESIGARGAPELTGLSVLRDGEPIARLDRLERSYRDDGAQAGTVVAPAPTIAANETTISFAFLPSESHPGPRHRYELAVEWARGQDLATAEAGRAAPELLGWEIRRDGEHLASLDPGVISFDDEGAAPGFVEAPVFESTSGQDAVELAWSAPPSREGSTHEYTLTLVADGAPGVTHRLNGRRDAPAIEGYLLRRDGEELASLGSGATAYLDLDAVPGEVDPPALSVTGDVDAVTLSWSAGTPRPGSIHDYSIEAVTALGPSVPATLLDRRSAPAIEGYEIERDQQVAENLGAGTLGWSDTSIEPGVVAAPAAVVTTATESAIQLSWSAAVASAGASHLYRVSALYGAENRSPSNAESGARGAPTITGYQVTRDDVVVSSLGPSVLEYEDAGASPGTVDAPPLHAVEATDAVQLTWTAPAAHPGANHRYTVAALTANGPGAASDESSAARAAPELTGLSVLRDGEPIAGLDRLERSYRDDGAQPGTVVAPAPTIAANETKISFAFLPSESHPGPRHRYELAVEWARGQDLATAKAGRAAPELLGWEIRRDGEHLESIDPGVISFDDEGAAPGFVEAPVFESTSSQDAVELAWSQPPSHEGSTHEYTLTLVADGAPGVTHRLNGRRDAPAIEGYLLRRDGEELASLGSGATAYLDLDAAPGEVDPPALSVTGDVDAVTLSWSPGTPRPGSIHDYSIEAVTAIGPSAPATLLDRRSAPAIEGYEIERDQQVAENLGAGTLGWSDTSIEPGVIAAPAAVVTTATESAIQLSWSAAVASAGASHLYRVSALYGAESRSPSNAESGARSAPPITGYQVTRDGVVVSSLGPSVLVYEDADASPGTVEAPSLQAVGDVGSVQLSWTPPAAHPGANHRYTVAVLTANGPGAVSNEATAARSGPALVGYRLLRNGALLAQVGPTATSHQDMQAAPGGIDLNLNTFRIANREDAVVFSWEIPSSIPGFTYTYALAAQWAEGEGLSLPVTAGRGAPVLTKWEVWRDDVMITELTPDTTSFVDEDAEPGTVGAPTLSATEGPQDVELAWAIPRSENGRVHEYKFIPVDSRGMRGTIVASGLRASPSIVGYRLLRDGDEIASLATWERSYSDRGAAPGELDPPSLVASGGSGSISLSWSQPATRPGPKAVYEIEALTTMGSGARGVLLAGRSAPEVTGFSIERDLLPLASLSPTTLAFDDTTASAGSFDDSVTLSASQGTNVEAVELRWQAPVGNAGPVHAYRVVASAIGAAPAYSAEETGQRGAPAVSSYQLQRDEGPWTDVGNVTAYDDTDAPTGTIEAEVIAFGDRFRGFIEAAFVREPMVVPPTPSSYRIRAVGDGVVGISSDEAIGYRKVGSEVEVQWQRSAADSDDGYADLPGVQTHNWLDFDTPVDEGRFYRASLRTEGVEAITPGSRAVAFSYQSIAAGGNFSCGVRSDGRVICWGNNQVGQAPPQPSTALFTSVTAGTSHACGLRADGKVECWGSNWFGQAPPQATVDSFESVNAGADHTCGVRTDGRVVCWGLNTSGQAPRQATTVSFKSVSGGAFHSCGVRTDGKVVCWGQNTYGQAPSSPTADSFSSVSAGPYHTCGVRLDRRIVCWGSNYDGQAPPSPSADLYTEVSAGDGYTCGLRVDGKVVCWGYNRFGGANPQATFDSFTSVSAGVAHTCGVRADGRARCWGANHSGEAPGSPQTDSFTNVSAGVNYTCGVRADGKVVCWGLNRNGQASTHPTVDSYSSVSASDTHACGLRTDGRVKCWGANNFGEAPATPWAASFTSVGTGPFYTCGIRVDGKVVCFGRNDLGQAPAQPSADSFTALGVGNTHSCGVRVDGKVICWGRNTYGQAPTVATADSFTSVSAGGFHTCGVRTDGKVVCWGRNDYGQAPTEATADSFTSVSAGTFHTCGIRVDGEVVCWGDHSAAVPTGAPFTSVSAGAPHTCGVRVDGKVDCWGPNTHGQAPPHQATP